MPDDSMKTGTLYYSTKYESVKTTRQLDNILLDNQTIYD